MAEMINYAYLETTNYCNLDCKFCNRRDVVSRCENMPLERWDMVLEKLSSQPITEAKLMGLGEPFLHSDFHEICRRFKMFFPQAFTISATNCQFDLNEKFVKTLPSLDLLYLSVDGYGENYEKYRPPAKWKKLLKFMDDLSEVETGKTRIAINYVVTSENHNDVPKLHALVAEKYPYIEEIRLNIAQWWGEDEDNAIEFKDEFLATLVKYKKNVKGKTPWAFSDCFWPKKGFYMNVNGDVRICCLNTSTEPIGNIFKSPLNELLVSPKRQLVARECKADKPGAHCRKCDYKKLSPVLGRILR